MIILFCKELDVVVAKIWDLVEIVNIACKQKWKQIVLRSTENFESQGINVNGGLKIENVTQSFGCDDMSTGMSTIGRTSVFCCLT